MHGEQQGEPNTPCSCSAEVVRQSARMARALHATGCTAGCVWQVSRYTTALPCVRQTRLNPLAAVCSVMFLDEVRERRRRLAAASIVIGGAKRRSMLDAKSSIQDRFEVGATEALVNVSTTRYNITISHRGLLIQRHDQFGVHFHSSCLVIQSCF